MIDLKKIFPIVLILFSFSVKLCFAGFGISPPYVFCDNLMPGSHYEQSISLIRSEIDKEAKVILQKDFQEMNDWIKIENENDLKFLAGEGKIILKAIVDVPQNAEIKQYKGKILVSIPSTQEVAGGASIALGAQVDIDLTVTDKVVDDFEITSIKILDCYEGEDIRALFGVRNNGNVNLTLKKISMDIYDINDQNILDTVSGSAMGIIPPNTRADIEVRFTPKLKTPGVYWAKIKVYNGEEIISDQKIFLAIKENTPERKAMLQGLQNKIQDSINPCSIGSRYFYIMIGLVIIALFLMSFAVFILMKERKMLPKIEFKKENQDFVKEDSGNQEAKRKKSAKK